MKNKNQPPRQTNFQNSKQLKKCLTEIAARIDRRAEKVSNRELLEICGEASDFLSRNADVAANCFQNGGQIHAPLVPDEKPVASGESDQLSNERIKTTEPLVYSPHWIAGGANHPGLIIETSGLANLAPPVTYRPHLPRVLSDKAILSAIQIERIIYAGQAHAQPLPTGARAGISIGDGTGKTSTLAGVISDNWFQGRSKQKRQNLNSKRKRFAKREPKSPLKSRRKGKSPKSKSKPLMKMKSASRN